MKKNNKVSIKDAAQAIHQELERQARESDYMAPYIDTYLEGEKSMIDGYADLQEVAKALAKLWELNYKE